MNPTDRGAKNEALSDAEATLRLIATLPAPEGLAERIQAGLQKAPAPGRLLLWPRSTSWRALAAAALLLAVAGGGWGAYLWTRPSPAAAPVQAPAAMRPALPGGFSAAGAIRTPQTLDGPLAPEAKASAAPAKNASHALRHAKTPKSAKPKAEEAPERQ